MTTPLLTTGTVNEVSVHLQGDIGGVGISRFRFIRNDAGVTTVADCNAAGAAVRNLYNSQSNWPSALSIAVQPTVELFDIGSALVQGFLTMSVVPGTITGSQAGAYGAGLGARINWKTATVSGRRLLKGSTYMVPMASGIFSSSGAVNSAIVSSLTTASAAYIAAMVTANLVPVIWHRPLKGQTVGGLVGPCTAAVVPVTPAGLRTRRS